MGKSCVTQMAQLANRIVAGGETGREGARKVGCGSRSSEALGGDESEPADFILQDTLSA